MSTTLTVLPAAFWEPLPIFLIIGSVIFNDLVSLLVASIPLQFLILSCMSNQIQTVGITKWHCNVIHKKLSWSHSCSVSLNWQLIPSILSAASKSEIVSSAAWSHLWKWKCSVITDRWDSKWLYRAIKISSELSPGFAGASGSLSIS